MTHYNAMQGSGYTEPEVPPSQDLEDDDPTVYQVRKYLKMFCRFYYQQISGGKLELEGNWKVEASVLRE